MEYYTTGVHPLDILLARTPKGIFIELLGTPESSWRTTIALHFMRSSKKAALYVDTKGEGREYVFQIAGKDTLYHEFDDDEKFIDMCDVLTKDGNVDIIVIDDVPSIVTKFEKESRLGTDSDFLTSEYMIELFIKIRLAMIKNKITVLLVNQIRDSMKDGVTWRGYGGRAMRQYPNVVLFSSKEENIIRGGEIVGEEIGISMLRNSFDNRLKRMVLPMFWNSGFDENYWILREGIRQGVIRRSRSAYSYKGRKVSAATRSGKWEMIKKISGSKELKEELLTEIYKCHGLKWDK